MGEKPHRAKQIFLWLNQKEAISFSEMTDLSKDLIKKLEKSYSIGSLALEEHLVSKDGTEKFLWRLEDGNFIETVYITEKKRKTLCLSTQVGCKIKCPFCASGSLGFIRNLKPSEITSQILEIQKKYKTRITNIVFMGIGEPLDNYDNLVKAIQIINDPDGINIGARKITVSTCGIIPGIHKLKKLGIQVELSISLHAANNTLRDKLVPINKKYPLEDLIATCQDYYASTGRVITLEYTLIRGENDSEKDARELGQIARKLKAKVNLITCNPIKPHLKTIDPRDVIKFRDNVRSKGVNVTVRKPKGMDIMAACGQLAGTKKK
jgi:23S rRNA (adenine2503-C2)-methyltransferase